MLERIWITIIWWTMLDGRWIAIIRTPLEGRWISVIWTMLEVRVDCHHLDYAGAVKVDCRHLDYAGGEVDCDFPWTASFIQLPASMVFWAPTMSISKTEERVYLRVFSNNAL